MFQALCQKIETGEAVIAILGMGHAGLSLATRFVGAHFEVIGFDTNAACVDSLRAGRSPILDVPGESLMGCLASGRFHPTTQTEELHRADIFIICVATPLSKNRQSDQSCIQEALRSVTEAFSAGAMVILESPAYPGTTEELLLPALSDLGLELDGDFLLAFSPNRMALGTPDQPMAALPKVVGGASQASAKAALALYRTVFERVLAVSSARAAELTQLLENSFRTVNVALVNEFSQFCEAQNVDPWEVIHATGTKPFGCIPFYLRPGIGGHGLSLDPQYPVYQLRLQGFGPRLAALADQINVEQVRFSLE